jgi:hypothetical protein
LYGVHDIMIRLWVACVAGNREDVLFHPAFR